MTITDIAQSFSIGQFSQVQPYFSQNIVWEIIGERQLSGIDQVLKHCHAIENYFKRISHEFQIQAVHQVAHHVIIQGEAQFHDAKQTSRISACDVYNFDALNQLVQIQSYCISIQ